MRQCRWQEVLSRQEKKRGTGGERERALLTGFVRVDGSAGAVKATGGVDAARADGVVRKVEMEDAGDVFVGEKVPTVGSARARGAYTQCRWSSVVRMLGFAVACPARPDQILYAPQTTPSFVQLPRAWRHAPGMKIEGSGQEDNLQWSSRVTTLRPGAPDGGSHWSSQSERRSRPI
nr:hypothetical protein CFP56_50342 [Quercus suber]